ncbi:hypothetical protein ACHAXS_004426 [Conticribra weissflogii]
MLLEQWLSLWPMLTLISSNCWVGGILLKCVGTCTSLLSQSPKILPDTCFMLTTASSPASLFLISLSPSLPFPWVSW